MASINILSYLNILIRAIGILSERSYNHSQDNFCCDWFALHASVWTKKW